MLDKFEIIDRASGDTVATATLELPNSDTLYGRLLGRIKVAEATERLLAQNGQMPSLAISAEGIITERGRE